MFVGSCVAIDATANLPCSSLPSAGKRKGKRERVAHRYGDFPFFMPFYSFDRSLPLAAPPLAYYNTAKFIPIVERGGYRYAEGEENRVWGNGRKGNQEVRHTCEGNAAYF
jgi:hypothetical protein